MGMGRLGRNASLALAAGLAAIAASPSLARRVEYGGDDFVRTLDLPPDFDAVPMPVPRATRQYRLGRSKYMPHIGDKERARHAGKPDGPMHGLPPLHRATP